MDNKFNNKRKIYYKGIAVSSLGLPITNKIAQKKKYFKNKKIYNKSFFSPFQKDSPKNLIVMYDISSEKKKERDYFRRHLKKFNYIMIQKSVWVGPSPLPKDFIDYVKSIGLENNIKTFKLAKEYSEKNNNFLKQ